MLKDQFQINFDSYFNTTEEVKRLPERIEKAKSGESLVHELFCFKKVRMAWFEVQSFLPDMNRESLKRSLSVLKNKEKLTRTKFKVMGPEGHECFQYELKIK